MEIGFQQPKKKYFETLQVLLKKKQNRVFT
jgi:hypothetical protein